MYCIRLVIHDYYMIGSRPKSGELRAHTQRLAINYSARDKGPPPLENYWSLAVSLES